MQIIRITVLVNTSGLRSDELQHSIVFYLRDSKHFGARHLEYAPPELIITEGIPANN